MDQVSEASPQEMEKQIYCLRESVEIRLMSDVPLGVFLSGGIDSSSIVALVSRSSSGPVKTFSVGYGEKFASFDELEFGRWVSDYYGTEHHEFCGSAGHPENDFGSGRSTR